MTDLKVKFKDTDYLKKWKIVRDNLDKIISLSSEPRSVNNSNKIVQTTSDFNDEISISEFSIVPSIETSKKSLKLVSEKARRASRVSDEFMHQYLKETKAAREQRHKLHLPSISSHVDRSKWSFDWSKLKMIDELENNYHKYQPTYQLEPKIKFNSLIAENIIQHLIDSYLRIVNINQVMSSKSTIKSSIDHLCTQIKTRIKSIADKRYKLVVSCNIIHQNYQGVIVASKCLWDVENDVCVTVKEVHKNYVIIINLFAVYHE